MSGPCFAPRPLGLARCLALLAAAWLLVSCGEASHSTNVASVNDGPIAVESYRAQMAFMGLGNDPTVLTPGLRRAVLETMVRRKLVLDQAQAKGIRLEPEEMDREEASLRRGLSEEAFERTLAAQGIEYYDWRRVMSQEILVQKTLDLLISSQVLISAEEVRAYYQEHRDQFKRAEQVLAQHALMPSKEMAQQLADRVLKGEDLGQAAAQLEAPLADDGEPSWLERGHMPPGLENKVFALEPGKVAGPLPSNYGFHVVRVLAKRPAMELDLGQAAEEIQRLLSAQKKEAMASSLVEEMRSSAKVWFDPGFEQSGKLGK
jgi:peptidyl-prolyl cis-trans isomerase C